VSWYDSIFERKKLRVVTIMKDNGATLGESDKLQITEAITQGGAKNSPSYSFIFCSGRKFVTVILTLIDID